MRLIDADKLRKTFENACIYGLPMNELYGAILKIIDNAPTVESDYEWGYSEGVHDTERPQGEWVIDSWGMYHCNYCMKEKQQLFNNFCSFCGAKMQKGGAV